MDPLRVGMPISDTVAGLTRLSAHPGGTPRAGPDGPGPGRCRPPWWTAVSMFLSRPPAYFATASCPHGREMNIVLAAYGSLPRVEWSHRDRAGTPKTWERLCHALDLQAMLDSTRVSEPARNDGHREEINGDCGPDPHPPPGGSGSILNGKACLCGPINTLREAFAGPAGRASRDGLGVHQPLERSRCPGFAVKLSGTPGTAPSAVAPTR